MSSPTPTSDRRRPGRPARSAGDVRERLIEAATELAIERGFDAAGIREIADRAGVSSGMISYYFGDRRGLNEAMFERALERMTRDVEEALSTLPEGADSIETLVRLHSAGLAADPWLPQLIAREVLATKGGLRARFADRMRDSAIGLVLDSIESAIATGKIRSDVDPSLCVLSLASLSVFPYLIGPVLGDRLGLEIDDTFHERLVHHNLGLIARGLRAREEETT